MADMEEPPMDVVEDEPEEESTEISLGDDNEEEEATEEPTPEEEPEEEKEEEPVEEEPVEEEAVEEEAVEDPVEEPSSGSLLDEKKVSDEEEEDITGGDITSAAKDPEPEPEPEPEPVKEEKIAAPKPKAAPSPAKSPTPKSPPPQSPKVAANYVFTVKITEPEKIGDGMSSYFVYKIEAKTNIKQYKTKDMTVSRRFSDFHTLMKVLISKYPGIIVPPCPPKDAVGTLVGKKQDGATKFIERRKKALERFLKRLIIHPTLVVDEVVRMFFETDAKMPVPGKVGSSLMSKITMYFETDEYFDDRWKQSEILESQLKRLKAGIEGLSLARRGLAGNTTSFAERFAALASAEELKPLTATMHQLADVEAKVAKFHAKEAVRDYYEFSEKIWDYIHLVGACKTAMVQRQEVNKIYIAAAANLDSKQKKEAKVKSDPKTSAIQEKVDQAESEVTEAKAKVITAKQNVIAISKLLRRELERFDFIKVAEFQQYCVEYIESVMNMEHQICKAWEAFLPEAKALQV